MFKIMAYALGVTMFVGLVSPRDASATETKEKRMGGVVSDDPETARKVPLVVSPDFLKRGERRSYRKDQVRPPRGASDVDSVSTAKRPNTKTRDTTPPVVAILSPVAGEKISGAITVSIQASDNIGVASVALFADGLPVGTTASAPYSFTWDPSAVADGNHELKAIAKDAAGNQATAVVSVVKGAAAPSDTTVPKVSITSPENGSTVSTTTVTVTVSASDDVAMREVAFSVDGAKKSALSAPPYEFAWDPTTVADGNHQLTATATDTSGNSSFHTILVSKNSVVIVLPSPTPLPTKVELLAPTPGKQGAEGSCVAFAVGYAARSIDRFYRTAAAAYDLGSNVFSPEFLYNLTKIGDCGSGTSVIRALEMVKNTGISSWQSMPYDGFDGCSTLPNASQLAEAALYRIASYKAVLKSDTAALKSLLAGAHPIIIMVILDQSFANAGPGFIWKSYSGAGGFSHAISIVGYDDSKHAFKVMNSWGTDWGEGGFSWIDYDYLTETGDVGAYFID
jgi:hypothetical protein